MIPLIETKHCNSEEWYDGQITDNMVCAGYAEGGKDSCQVNPPTCFNYCVQDRLSVCLLLIGLREYYWLDLPDKKTKDGSWSNLDPIKF